MNDRIKGILQILFAILVIVLIIYFEGEIKKLEELGYIGVFLISVLGSATIFFPAPGRLVVFSLGRVLDPLLVGIIGGVGSAIGELTGYAAGSGVVKLLKADKYFKKFKAWIKKYDILAIFIFAVIPNPIFDVAGIAAGSLGIPWWRYLLATAAGRVIGYVALAYLGEYTIQFFKF